MEQAFQQAYTMSQLYVSNRPKPVPLTEYQQRRKEKDMKEIMDAAAKRGKNPLKVRESLEQLEVLLPGLINLYKMKASDWVAMGEDVNAMANKLVLLKTYYPQADIFRIVAQRPKTLMQSDAVIKDNAEKVKKLLGRAEDPDAIIQSLPELMDPTSLSRALGYLQQQFPDQDPVHLLQKNPNLLLNLVESDVEDSAEYGELSTKD